MINKAKIGKLKNIAFVKCGWCRYEFETITLKGEHGYPTNFCPSCGRRVSASIKELTGNNAGRKHIHRDLKDGDVV